MPIKRQTYFYKNMLEDIQKTLWATADKLRANIDAAELMKDWDLCQSLQQPEPIAPLE